MTGGSLGQRTSSYGSLQQHQQNSVVLFPIQTSPVIVRKPLKMLLSGSREKEKILHRICKFAGRRRVGMLLVVVISVVVFMSILYAITKDEDASGDTDSDNKSILHVQNSIYNGSISLYKSEPTLIRGEKDNKDDNFSLPNTVPISDANNSQPPPLPAKRRNNTPLSLQ